MGIENNWKSFINITRERNKAHVETAWYWNTMHTALNLSVVLLTGLATLVSVLEQQIPSFVVPLIAGVATVVSSVNAFFKPAERYQRQLNSANTFNILMFKMVRCTTQVEYDELWEELYQAKLNEPFLLSRHRREIDEIQDKMKFSMSCALKKDAKNSSDEERIPLLSHVGTNTTTSTTTAPTPSTSVTPATTSG